MKYNFTDLIHPHSLEDFEKKFFEKRFFYNPQVLNTGFLNLLRKKDVFNLLHDYDVGFPKIQISLGGKIDHERYTHSQRSNTGLTYFYIDHKEVMSLYESGHSIILELTDVWHKKLSNLRNQLCSQINSKLRVNAYLSPPGSPCFPRHYDDHDVMILQLEGQKTWKLFEPPLELPNKELNDIRYADINPQFNMNEAEELETVLMSEGDFLYLPRGTIHEVIAEESDSLHLTIGFKTSTVFDYLEHLNNDPEFSDFRKTLSLSLDESENLKNLKKYLQEAIEKIDQKKIEQYFHTQKFSQIDGFISTLSENQDESILKYNLDIPCRYSVIDDDLIISANNEMILVSKDFLQLFLRITEEMEIKVADISKDKKTKEFLEELKKTGLLY